MACLWPASLGLTLPAASFTLLTPGGLVLCCLVFLTDLLGLMGGSARPDGRLWILREEQEGGGHSVNSLGLPGRPTPQHHSGESWEEKEAMRRDPESVGSWRLRAWSKQDRPAMNSPSLKLVPLLKLGCLQCRGAHYLLRVPCLLEYSSACSLPSIIFILNL